MNNLADLPASERVFVDANIFALHYIHVGALGDACRDFFARAPQMQWQLFTSALVVSEVIHRLIVSEASQRFALPARDTVAHLQTHPEIVRQLSRHLTVASEIHRMGIDILSVTYKELHASKDIRAAFGLMANDSLIVAVMRANKLRHLATHDAGFARVSNLQMWGPAW